MNFVKNEMTDSLNHKWMSFRKYGAKISANWLVI